ncbi:MAG: hypothetical protein AAF483_19920 [Planctomycetota bacterium]
MPVTTNAAPETRSSSAVTPPAIVRAETNFLRFPFFALSTKDIHRIDFREVTGTRKIKSETGESTVDFSYRVSRITDHVFPGILSRNIHFALLSIMARSGAVPTNPIHFSWRQLAGEMGVSYGGGKMIKDMKQAIRSTHGTVIRTDHALIDGTQEDRPTIRRERGLYLYKDYLFQDETLPDGSMVDRNQVTLSDWYFNNLKARYIQPLDFDLWLRLNRQTPVASRLYEYLVFVFGHGSFRKISYAKLAASIPVKAEKHLSLMKRQLTPALKSLLKNKLLKRVHWTTGTYGDVMLELQRGECLKLSVSPLAHAKPTEDVSFQTRDSFDEQKPTERFIKRYYLQRFNVDHVVTDNERNRVSSYVEQYGLERLFEVLPKLVRRMKSEFPKGMSILAATNILEQLLAVPKNHRDSEHSVEADEPRPLEKKQRRLELQKQWDSLSALQQVEAEKIVTSRLGKRKHSTGFQLMLLHEADRLFFES